MPRLMQNVEWAILYIRGVLISWVVANHENNEIKTPWIFCRFTVYISMWHICVYGRNIYYKLLIITKWDKLKICAAEVYKHYVVKL